jgi:hypothetical protein
MKRQKCKGPGKFKYLGAFLAIAAVVLFAPQAHADIGTAIDDAAGQVKGIFSNVSNLILMIGGVVGLVGGIRVYQKWNGGERDIQKEIVGWAGSCIFLLLVGTALKTIYGI